MATPLYKKLRIKENDSLLTINAPGDFQQSFDELPQGISISSSVKRYNQVHWFVQNRAQVEKQLNKVITLLIPGIIIWVYYPKGTSGMQTDLTRDKGWDALLAYDDKLTLISLISFNETWSVFGFRAKTVADKKKDAGKTAQREIFNWVNPQTKEVILPDDLIAAFGKNKTQAAFFDSLSFTNKKEYIEWIVTAKRDETRKERIAGTIERLGKNWKNPANR